MDRDLDAALVQERLLVAAGLAFGGVGLVVAVVGLFGLLSETVTSRTREIGVRMALGATAGDGLRLVLRDAFVATAVGVILGVPVLWLVGTGLEAVLQGVNPATPSAIAVAATLSVVSAIVAAWVPGRRAVSVDPAETLRRDC